MFLKLCYKKYKNNLDTTAPRHNTLTWGIRLFLFTDKTSTGHELYK